MATEIRVKSKIAWRRLMLSDEGKEVMLWLREQVPSVYGEGKTAEQIIFQSGVSEGFRRAFDTINEILAADKESEVDPSNDR